MAETQRRDGLPPLEYSDCFLDSPSFRDLIDLYDKELEANGADVKALIKGCQSMIDATQGTFLEDPDSSTCYAS